LFIFTPKTDMARKAVTEFTVIENRSYGRNQQLLVLRGDDDLLPVCPGQFVNVEIPDNKDVFLRRPFSVFGYIPEERILTLLVKELGKGSQSLARVSPGRKLSIIYPLGRGFTLPIKGERTLAVGGGSGVAPLLFLAASTAAGRIRTDVLLGARSAADHIPPGTYTQIANCMFTTEDGSLGEKGMVTDHPVMNQLEVYDRIYTCGPLPMMKAVAAVAKRKGIFCEVSLENLMACGFGVCLCCIEPTVKGNLCVCTEGPVFNVNDLLW
jgi:dihydroorotate dehydrogenase electron transfer subunit